MSPVEFSIFVNRITAICMEMGAVLERSALSPNIKDRLDFSCALFDATGGLVAQAAHIPVHLGSMAYAMSDLVEGWIGISGMYWLLMIPFSEARIYQT